ncbi:MAG: hypothetical protein JST14_02480 [Bacteroidetes bacterium]|nr:hypothetical protein [Bacteroidota bacterium]
MRTVEIHKALAQHALYPLPHHVLLSILKDYKRPNDKINELIKERALTPIKKGLYIAGPSLDAGKPEPYLLANYIYGPSYVSLETALSFHGMIPERVYEVASMTTKASRRFSTDAGVYSYTKLPLPYYAYGIEQISFAEKQTALVASKEKALCDKIMATPGVLFRSKSQAESWLLEDLRIDPIKFRELRIDEIGSWVKEAPKKASMEMLLKVLKEL